MRIEEAAEQWPQDQGLALFDTLRAKWSEVPGGLSDRVLTDDVLALSDRELRDFWQGVLAETTTGPGFAVRGWYHAVYSDIFRGRRVLEIGSGMGIDGIHFIREGAIWHFTDIVPSNLSLIRRTLVAFNLHCEGMTLIESLASLDTIRGGFDFIYCPGSLIHVPFAFARVESLSISRKIRPGGRWIELGYPRERWTREGRLSFNEWGRRTDGEATPWVEWYDLDRMCERFAPVMITPILAFNFHGDDFSWMDLRIDNPPTEARFRRAIVNGTRTDIPLGLDTFLTHGTSSLKLIGKKEGLEVSTMDARWSFCVHRSLEASDVAPLLDDSNELTPTVLLRIRVDQGSVGVGVLDASFRTYLGLERYFEASDEAYMVRMPLSREHPIQHLMFRNASSDGVSRFRIDDALLVAVEEFSATETGAPAIALSELVRRHWSSIARETPEEPTAFQRPAIPVFVRAVDIDALSDTLGVTEDSRAIPTDRGKSLLSWTMEVDDAPILAFLYRHWKAQRHLEFGTWEGAGAVLVARCTSAEIWTLNLPGGEVSADGTAHYERGFAPDEPVPDGALPVRTDASTGQVYRTDAGAFIGWQYRAAGYGSRVHQILADSRAWDTSAFPDGFFDTVLIDGGHTSDVVTSDTEKALRLLRPGGLMIWHDFCPVDSVMAQSATTRGVVAALHKNWRRWSPSFDELMWIRPSYILIGVKQLESIRRPPC
jgi:predicted O-methyltransferase YrrM